MKNFKKLFAIATILATVATNVPVATLGAASYSDELQGAYDYAYGIGITTQSSIDTANMYGSLLRSHMAKMMVNYAKEVLGKTPDTTKSCSFTDVANESDELQGYITESCQLGLMGVDITAFNPNGVVTRAQFGTVLSRALYGDANDGGDPYYVNHLNALKDAGIMTNISNPNAPEVRGYVMLMMQRASGDTTPAVCSTPENALSCSLGLDTCPSECTTTVVDEVKDGTLSVSLASDTPDANDVPLTSAYTTYLKFNLTASKDVTVRSIDVARKGLGNSNDFDKIWVENANGVVVAKAKTISSSDTVTLSFVSNYTVKSSEKLVLAASHKNVVANAGHLNYFSITAVDCSANVAGLPVSGNNMRISSYAAAKLVLTNPGAASQVEVGGTQVIVGEFKLTENEATNNKDVELISIRLKNSGTEKVASFNNFKLYNDGTLASDEVSIDGEYITFSFTNGLIIKDGLSKSFTVKADVVEGRDAQNINLEFKEAYDLKAIETTTGIGAAVDVASKIVLSVYTIKAGKFNLNADTTNPVASNLSLEQTEVPALIAKISLDQAVTVVDGIKVFLDNTKTVIGGAATTAAYKTEIDNDFKAVKLYVNGKLIDTVDTVSYTDGATPNTIEANEFYYQFDNSFDLKSGDLIAVKFDVKTASTATTTDAMALNLIAGTSFGATASTVEYADGNTLAIADRVGTVNGNTMTIKAATLTIADNSGYGASTKITVGTNGAKIAKFIVNAGSSSAAVVKRLKLSIDTAAADILEYQEYTSLTLKVDGVEVGSMVNATQDSAAANGKFYVTFDGLNIAIAKSAQKTFEVYGNMSQSAAAGLVVATVLGSALGSTVNDQSSNPITFADKAMANYTVTAAGSMSVAKDGTSPATKILLANANNQTVAKFKFQATDEAIDITDLYVANDYTANGTAQINNIAVTIANAAAAQTDTVTINGTAISFTSDATPTVAEVVGGLVGAINGSTQAAAVTAAGAGTPFTITSDTAGVPFTVSVSANLANTAATANVMAAETAADPRFGTFNLYVGDNTTPLIGKSLVDGKLVFEDLPTRISVPANGNVVITIKADVSSVTQADQSNAKLKLALYAGKAVSHARGTAVAIGSLAATDTFTSTGLTPADLMVVRKTVPTLTTQALTTTKLTAGEQTIYKMTATADVAGDVEISTIKFNLTNGMAGGKTINTPKLFIDGTEQTATEGAFAAGTYVWTFVAGKELAVGNAPKTIELKGTPSGAPVTSDYISVNVIQNATQEGPLAAAPGGFTAPTLVWSDLSGAPHSSTSLDRYNGYKTLGLDTATQTLSF